MKNKLAIWDFDGTLYKTPNREEGEAIFFETIGEKWGFAGWWGRIESLLPPIIPNPPPRERLIEAVYQDYLTWKADPHAHNVLLTGRPPKTSPRVKEILEHFDIFFDEEYFRNGSFDQDTFDLKANIIQTKLIHDKLEILEIWEDRPEHVKRFINLAQILKSKTLNHIVVHDVTAKVNHKC